MKARNLLLCLAMAFAFVSCGTQKAAVTETNEGPLIPTKIMGVEFGSSPNRVYYRISRYRLIKQNDGSYTIVDRDFGGFSWHYVRMEFVDKMLYIVNFQQEYNLESSATDRFESVYRMLRLKYGDMEVTQSGNGFSFTDANKNMVTVTVQPGTSRSGKSFWYCDLTYYWGAGAFLSTIKSLGEI